APGRPRASPPARPGLDRSPRRRQRRGRSPRLAGDGRDRLAPSTAAAGLGTIGRQNEGKAVTKGTVGERRELVAARRQSALERDAPRVRLSEPLTARHPTPRE